MNKEQFYALFSKGMEGGSAAARGGGEDQLLREYLRQKERDDTDMRLETGAIQNEFNRTGMGDARKQVDALSNIENMLADPQAVDQGRIGTELRNLVETGVATEGDIERQQPTTWRSITNKLGTFLGKGNLVDPYSQEHLGHLKDYVKGRKRTINNRVDLSRQELQQRAPQLAPTLHRKGQLQGVMNSLGVAPQQLMQKPPAGPSGSDPAVDEIIKALGGK